MALSRAMIKSIQQTTNLVLPGKFESSTMASASTKKNPKKKHVQFKVEESDNVDKAMKLFLVFEQGESGVLSFSEFNEAIHEMGLDPSSEQTKRLFNRVDGDGNGRIDFEEFLKLFEVLDGKGKTESQSKAGETDIVDEDRKKSLQLLKMFDTDGDGQLSIAEWQNVLGRMGMKCSTKEAKALFRNVDANGDGNIDLDEFMKYLSS